MQLHNLVITTFALTTIGHPHPQNERPKYSIQMAKSIISRHQGILTSTSDRSNLLQAGFTQKSFCQLIRQYPNHTSTVQIAAYMSSSVSSVIPTIRNATLDTTFPLDRLSSGNGLIYAYQSTKNETYRKGYEALQDSLELQPRNAEGSIWYYTYPNYTYLDGMYSLAPFLTLYATLNGSSTTVSDPMEDLGTNDVLKQLDLAWNHTYHPSSGLLVHGYDASKRAMWANPVSGASPYVWGRSLGWYCMALLDTLDLLPSSFPSVRAWLLHHYQSLMNGVMHAVDKTSGAWWQVMDQPGREGNYIESSASAMFVYSLLRGTRLGYLEHKRNVEIAMRAYEYLVDEFVVDNGNGTLSWNGTVSVCSLNSTATYEYYVGQPILYDSVLGSAAFVLASLEYEKLNATAV